MKRLQDDQISLKLTFVSHLANVLEDLWCVAHHFTLPVGGKARLSERQKSSS
jgi:hypothetical protein